jgi:hypothetical protein
MMGNKVNNKQHKGVLYDVSKSMDSSNSSLWYLYCRSFEESFHVDRNET